MFYTKKLVVSILNIKNTPFVEFSVLSNGVETVTRSVLTNPIEIEIENLIRNGSWNPVFVSNTEWEFLK